MSADANAYAVAISAERYAAMVAAESLETTTAVVVVQTQEAVKLLCADTNQNNSRGSSNGWNPN